MRIIFCLLTIMLLLGALAMRAGFAEEAGPGARSDSNPAGLPTEPSASPPSAGESAGPNLDSQWRGQTKGDDAKTPSGEGAQKETGGVTNDTSGSGRAYENDDAIDMRIGTQPRRFGNRTKVGNVKARVRLLQARHPAAPGSFDQGTRNAIGLPLARHEGQERRDGEHHGVTNVAPNPSTSGVGASMKADGHLERATTLHANPLPSVSPSTFNRGTINGTGATRPGAGPRSIGGPARAVAGISGSAIRRKH